MTEADLDALLAAAQAGERRPLARLLSAIEAADPALRQFLPRLFAASRGAHLVGITGPPGSGKSTLVNALTAELRRRGRRVGIVAVDPSSPYTGGAIMGDRIRMMEHAADRDVFVRSMASRGEPGGLAATTWIVAAALDAAGFDPVMIETVGAGQSEVEIARLAETTVVVEVPEMGDEVQAIKAGLLEIADVLVINKGDRPGADQAARRLRAMMSSAGGRVARQLAEILVTTATSGDGVVELADAIARHREQARRPEQARQHSQNLLRRALAEVAVEKARAPDVEPLWDRQLELLAKRATDPYSAAELLLNEGLSIAFESKTATVGERLVQQIYGGFAVERFPAAADFIEQSVRRGEWWQPNMLMIALLNSDEVDRVLPLIEGRARVSDPFRRQLIFTMRGYAERLNDEIPPPPSDAVRRLLVVAKELEAEFPDELGDVPIASS